MAVQLLSQVETMGKKVYHDQAVIEQLTHEIALLKRHKFAKRSEQLSPDQISLLDELIDTDIAAIEASLKAESGPRHRPTPPADQALRAASPVFTNPDRSRAGQHSVCPRLPAQADRQGRRRKARPHPGHLHGRTHIRGKWVCNQCEPLIQAPVPAQMIDKGIPAAGLLAHVMVAK